MSSPATVRELVEIFKERKWTVEDTFGKGVHVITPNGYSVSIQWGPGNYCSNRNDNYLPVAGPHPESYLDSPNAEIQVYYTQNGPPIQFEGWTQALKGWVPVAEILAITDYIAEGKLMNPTEGEDHGLKVR